MKEIHIDFSSTSSTRATAVAAAAVAAAVTVQLGTPPYQTPTPDSAGRANTYI